MKDQAKTRTTRRQKRRWMWFQTERGSRSLRRAWLLLVLLPLLAVGLVERHVMHSRSVQPFSSLRALVLLLGGPVFLFLFGWGWCSALQPRPPDAQEQREAARRRERIRLFHLAQGKRPWHAQRVTQWVLALLGLGFFLLGLLLVVQAMRSGSPVSVEAIMLGISSTLGGVVLLLETVCILPSRLRHLSSQSAMLLKAQLLAGEYEGAETASQQEENPEAR